MKNINMTREQAINTMLNLLIDKFNDVEEFTLRVVPMSEIAEDLKNTSVLDNTVKSKIMMNIYYNDGVNPSKYVHTCNTLEDAKEWVNKQLKGYTMVDVDHPCTKDNYQSSKIALYQVFYGEPITLNEHGEPNLAEPIYTSDYFYTE